MLSIQTIEPDTLELLKQISELPQTAQMRLVGGTALALQYGHRKSIDLDFFGAMPDDREVLMNELRKIGSLTILNTSPKILQTVVNGIKVDFVDYQYYDWIDTSIKDGFISLASPKDIAAMKVNAAINRGTKKDFVDIFVLLQHYSLAEILDFYRKKYPDFSDYRALLSLTYFEDADQQDMPILLIPNTWEEMKQAIINAVKQYQA